jgi:hypothetical protein
MKRGCPQAPPQDVPGIGTETENEETSWLPRRGVFPPAFFVVEGRSATRGKVMTQRSNEKPRRNRAREDRELQALYDEMRRKFTAADLQKYTEAEEGVPLERVISAMEEIHRNFRGKKA